MPLRHYRVGHGEPLVLIHGLGSRWQIWEPVLDALVWRREILALDLPGFGASPMPAPGTPAGLPSLARLVREFLAEQGIERPHVAGNSLGGLIALELARQGQARSACALSPAGFATAPEMAVTRSLLWVSVRAARRMAPHADELMATAAGRTLALGAFAARPARMSRRDAAANIRALAGAPWFDATLPSLDPHGFRGGAEIDVPVTIAWGEKDRVLFPRQAARAARAIPGARLIMLPGCGHVPTYDDPERVAAILLEASAGGGGSPSGGA